MNHYAFTLKFIALSTVCYFLINNYHLITFTLQCDWKGTKFELPCHALALFLQHLSIHACATTVLQLLLTLASNYYHFLIQQVLEILAGST